VILAHYYTLYIIYIIFTCLPSLIFTKYNGLNILVHRVACVCRSASLNIAYSIMSKNVSWNRKGDDWIFNYNPGLSTLLDNLGDSVLDKCKTGSCIDIFRLHLKALYLNHAPLQIWLVSKTFSGLMQKKQNPIKQLQSAWSQCNSFSCFLLDRRGHFDDHEFWNSLGLIALSINKLDDQSNNQSINQWSQYYDTISD